MGFRKRNANKSDNRSKAKVVMGKPASQLTKEDKKILSARIAEIKSANGGKTTVQNTIPYMCMYKDGVCQVSENFFSMTVQFYDANYSISEFEEQNNIFSKYCDVINLFDNTIKFQLTFENQNRSKEKLVKTVQIPEQDDDFNAIRKEYSEMLTEDLEIAPPVEIAPTILRRIRQRTRAIFLNRFTRVSVAAVLAIVIWIGGFYRNGILSPSDEHLEQVATTARSIQDKIWNWSSGLDQMLSGFNSFLNSPRPEEPGKNAE